MFSELDDPYARRVASYRFRIIGPYIDLARDFCICMTVLMCQLTPPFSHSWFYFLSRIYGYIAAVDLEYVETMRVSKYPEGELGIKIHIAAYALSGSQDRDDQ
ncbi:hypothetical protein RF11_02377 [Thelohanellus kitauei]|uniref:Uncharacterized protein n=1 Tax=Thelohanellus kitauei TaxID=669202 RepID=A0A0C2J5U0_THEKT|nr:hypothetical protein RF11_02377 [Thelohanellus kitauei]